MSKEEIVKPVDGEEKAEERVHYCPACAEKGEKFECHGIPNMMEHIKLKHGEFVHFAYKELYHYCPEQYYRRDMDGD